MKYEIIVPASGFSVTEGTIIEWLKGIGEKVEEGETVVILETDKVTVEIPALATGILVDIRFKKGETAPVGAVLGIIAEEGEAGMVETRSVASEAMETKEAVAPFYAGAVDVAGGDVGDKKVPRELARQKISPVARKLAEREGIDLSAIKAGSGPGGRIVKEDILCLVEAKKAKEPEREERPEAEQAEVEIRLTGWRKVIADRMIASARDVPQGRTLIEVDVTDLARVLSAVKQQIEKPRITYLPFLMKAIQAGIGVTPEVNAYCYEDRFVLKRELNIGMAVEVGEKLVVPVIKRVREKSILELAEEIEALAERAREERLKPQDVQDGTITITNLGPFDVYAAMPLVLPPQTTIVAIGTVRDQPWVVNGSIEIRKKVMITGVFDHRAVNGAPGARFLKALKRHLEDLNQFILGMR